MPAISYDIPIDRGSTVFPLIRRYADEAKTARFDWTGSTVVFRVLWTGGELRKSSADGGISIPTPTNGEFQVIVSAAETRSIPIGAIAAYEIERRIGAVQEVFMRGLIDAHGGTNDD